jgi:hypothetical protein
MNICRDTVRLCSLEGDGLQVILGMELRFFGNADDYLVFGIDESFLKAMPYLFMKDLKYFTELHNSMIS